MVSSFSEPREQVPRDRRPSNILGMEGLVPSVLCWWQIWRGRGERRGGGGPGDSDTNPGTAVSLLGRPEDQVAEHWRDPSKLLTRGHPWRSSG